MDAARQIVVIIFALVVSVATSVLVCIKGWGLEPRSWWWILLVYPLGQILSLILIEIGKRDED